MDKIKQIGIFVLFLTTIGFTCRQDDVEIKASLKLKEVETKEFGKIPLIEILIRNTSSNRIYVEDIKPISFKIYKQVGGDSYTNYFNKWINNELNLDDIETIGNAIGEENSSNKIYDVLSNKFIDSDAKEFYQSSILKNKNFVQNDKEKRAIKKWVRDRYEKILYLDENQLYQDITGISTLGPGRYKIWFYYKYESPIENYYPREFYDSLTLELPEQINGYNKWAGIIHSDTLFFDVK